MEGRRLSFLILRFVGVVEEVLVGGGSGFILDEGNTINAERMWE